MLMGELFSGTTWEKIIQVRPSWGTWVAIVSSPSNNKKLVNDGLKHLFLALNLRFMKVFVAGLAFDTRPERHVGLVVFARPPLR